MRSSNRVDVKELIGEVEYRLGFVASHLNKVLDKERFQYDDFLTQSTSKQVVFLESKELTGYIPLSEYSDAVNLYHDVLKSLLDDMNSGEKDFKDIAIDKYQCIRQSLDSEIGAIEHNEFILCDVSYLLNYMYNIVKKKSKENHFKDL